MSVEEAAGEMLLARAGTHRPARLAVTQGEPGRPLLQDLRGEGEMPYGRGVQLPEPAITAALGIDPSYSHTAIPHPMKLELTMIFNRG